VSSNTLSNSDANGENEAASTSTILSDLSGLFTLISKETTALSLAFAPPKETWDAVQGVAKNLQDLVGKIAFALDLLQQRQGRESLLAKEWFTGSENALVTLKELIDTSHTIYTAQFPASGKIKPEQRKQILTETSLVWKAVEKLEKLSKDEISAFVKVWTALLAVMQDALSEVEELTQRTDKGKGKAEDSEDDEDDDFGDDFGDDFDYDDGEPLSPEELEVALSAIQLMKFVKALFKKLSTSTFTSTLSHISSASTLLIRIHHAGQAIQCQQDELASTLYHPQSLQDIATNTREYQALSLKLLEMAQSGGEPEDLAQAVSGLTLSNGSDEKAEPGADRLQKKGELDKWCAACRLQIERTATDLLAKCEPANR
jgi:hypothetical protein